MSRAEEFGVGATEHVFTIDVGFTTERPVKPEQYTSRVTISGHTSEADAHATAANMVGSRPNVVMPTSTKTVRVEV